MNFSIEQLRLYVLTRHKTGTATNDIIHEMTQVHSKDNVLSRSTVHRWIQDIKNVSFESSKGKTTGRPRAVRTPALIDRVKYSIEKDPRQSVRTVAHKMRVPYNLIHRILTEDLQLRKYCSVWVPTELTDEHKKGL